MDHGPNNNLSLDAVPLFPLPTVVLFPMAVLPLHIFEQRYRMMTADVLAGDRQLAMALLKPGWEKHYHCRPEIENVVCVGRVLSWERLADGRYNFLLQGTQRAEIVREHGDKPYRIAELRPLVESTVMEIDLVSRRQRLLSQVNDNLPSEHPAGRQLRALLTGPLNTAVAADLMAYGMIDDVSVKQSLLAETDVARRVERIVNIVERLLPTLSPEASGSPKTNMN